MRRFTYLPWDLRSWRQAFQQAGTPGLAMLLLVLADTLALPTTTNHALHESTTDLLIFRLPLGGLAAFLAFSNLAVSKVRIHELRFWYGIYLLVFWASVSWSEYPFQTAGKALELTVGFFIVMEAARGSQALVRLQAMLRLLILTDAALALVTVLAYFTRLPEFVKHKPGFFTQTSATSSVFGSDGLGYFSVTLILVTTVEFMSRSIHRRQFIKQLAFAGFIFFFSSSRSSLGIFFAGAVYILWRRSKIAAIVFCVSVVGVAAAFSSKIIKYLSFHQPQGSVDTLSGRTVMWLAAIGEWKKSPWLGYGGGVGGKWAIEHIMGSNSKGINDMPFLHNGYLECLVGVGIIGMFFSMAVFIVAIVRTLRLWRRYPQYSWLFIWIVSFTLQTAVGPGMMGWMSDVLGMYLIFIVFLDVLQKSERERTRATLYRGLEPEVPLYSVT